MRWLDLAAPVGAPVIPWQFVGETDLFGEAKLSLWRRDLEGRPSEFSLRITEPNTPPLELMNSRQHGSEEELAEVPIAMLGRTAASTLIGGLGMGYTLRAALDALPADSRVTIAELVPQVVEWNRGELAELAGSPLDDPRVRVHVGDVAELVRAARNRYDLILLDTDNGPEGTSSQGNEWLYSSAGLKQMQAVLEPGGILAVWSAFDSEAFTKRLQVAGFEVEVKRTRARGKRGPRHVIWLAKRR